MRNGVVPLYSRGNPEVSESIALDICAPGSSRNARGLYATKFIVPETQDALNCKLVTARTPTSPACKPIGKNDPAAGELAVAKELTAVRLPVPAEFVYVIVIVGAAAPAAADISKPSRTPSPFVDPPLSLAGHVGVVLVAAVVAVIV
jgi:hypothetical protein